MIANRDEIVIIGSTGSLGKPLVSELLRRGKILRLVGRSWKSIREAGYVQNEYKSVSSQLSIAICKNVDDRDEYLDEWFSNACCVISVARPRSLNEGDSESYRKLVENLVDAVIKNGVPYFILHGIPYIQDMVFTDSPTMKIRKEAEVNARERINQALHHGIPSLTITRCCEMTEIGHILESTQMLGFFPSAFGYDPLLHPISSRDFATAIANSIDEATLRKPELLVGGPRQLTWRELGLEIAKSHGKKFSCISLPLSFYKIMIYLLGILSNKFPPLRGLYISLKLLMIPMTTNTTNRDSIYIGVDTVDSFLMEQQLQHGENGWVHQRVFGKMSCRKNYLDRMIPLPSSTACARLVAFIAASDAIVAFIQPNLVGKLENLDVREGTVEYVLVLGVGVAACCISMMTFLSVTKGRENVIDTMSNRRAIEGGIAIEMCLILWFILTGNVSEIADKMLLLVHAYIAICALVLFSLIFIPSIGMHGAKILSLLVVTCSLCHYFYPTIIFNQSLDLEKFAVKQKSVVHSKQVAMYFLASGVQMLMLSYDHKAEKAVGAVCAVWFVVYTDLLLRADVIDVFEMSQLSRCINLMFPICTGTLAGCLLLGT